MLCFALKFPADMLWLLWLIFALSLITAGQRFVKVWRQAEQAPAPLARRADRGGPALAGLEGGAGAAGRQRRGPGRPGPGSATSGGFFSGSRRPGAGPVAGAGTNGGWNSAQTAPHRGTAISAAEARAVDAHQESTRRWRRGRPRRRALRAQARAELVTLGVRRVPYRVGSHAEQAARRVPRRSGRGLGSTGRGRRLGLAPRVGALLGRLPDYDGRRAVVASHMARVLGRPLGQREERRMVAEVFANYGRYWAESLRLPSCTTVPRWQPGWPRSGGSTSRRPWPAGKGAIIAAPHLGGWEWGAMYLVGNGHAGDRRRRAARAPGPLRVVRPLPGAPRDAGRRRSGPGAAGPYSRL